MFQKTINLNTGIQNIDMFMNLRSIRNSSKILILIILTKKSSNCYFLSYYAYEILKVREKGRVTLLKI